MHLAQRLTLSLVAAAVGAVLFAGCQGAAGGAAPRATGSPGTATSSSSTAPAAGESDALSTALATRFRALERDHDRTLGIVAVDTGTGRTVEHRGDTRFPFASTNKTFIAAAVLDASSAADLDTVVHYSQDDLLAYAPVTSQHVDEGMTVRALLTAMLQVSDNTAANLLVDRVGGPDGVERWLRGIGDEVTEVDRVEPELNEALPGDDRDTTTPAQFADDLRQVLLGRVLDGADRDLLRETMLGNTTGADTVRAGVDPSWPVADKTGTGEYGVRNDIAVAYPTGAAPIVVVVMSRGDSADAEPDDALLAAATRLAVDRLTR